MTTQTGVTSFPLGGIGTGTVGLGDRGELRDWQLQNRPDAGRTLPFTFFAIHVAPSGGSAVTRVLEGRLRPPHAGQDGYDAGRVAGLPRFRTSRLRGEYPFVHVELLDERVPVAVDLEAFTPFVPLDADDSGIPGAILRYRVTNLGAAPVRVTVAGSVCHPAVGLPTASRRRDQHGIRGIDLMTLPGVAPLEQGTIALTTAHTAVTTKAAWLRGYWNDGIQSFWNEFATDGMLSDEPAETLDRYAPSIFDAAERPVTRDELDRRPAIGSLGILLEIPPGETRTAEFVLAWSFPYRPRAWNGFVFPSALNSDEPIRNHYAVRYPDAWAAAADLVARLPELEGATRAFHSALFGGTLDPAVVDAASATLATLRSTTCFRLEDGTFAAWEGSFDRIGSCEGTCTHVWNYAQSVAWLFPDLERSARRVEFELETDDQGAMQFRTNRVFGGPSWGALPAADGQFGTIVRLLREFRLSGDEDWLRACWPHAVRALEFGIRHWDPDDDGLLEGEAHTTYDIEFLGPEPLVNGMHLAALHAAAALADHLGEVERAAAWRARAARGAAAMDAVLWHGDRYRQVAADPDARRYQYGDGVLSDQLLGQTLAHLTGLGHIVDPAHARTALATVHRANLRRDLSEHLSVQRTYALNDEGGLLLCSWPDGGRPRVPFIYSDEVWTGIEYQVATGLIFEGLVEEGLEIVRIARARYDGVARDPWDELECGHHYARSLAAWGLVVALGGVTSDIASGSLAFSPARDGAFRSIFSTGRAWGTVAIDGGRVDLAVVGGRLQLGSFAIRGVELLGPGTRVDLRAGESATLFAAGT